MKHSVITIAFIVSLVLADSSMASSTPAAGGDSNQWTWDSAADFPSHPSQNQNSLGNFTYDIRMCCRYVPMDPAAASIVAADRLNTPHTVANSSTTKTVVAKPND